MTEPSEQEHPLIDPAELTADFETFFRDHKNEFLKSADSRVRNVHDAEEIVLTAGARIHRKWELIKAHANPIAYAHQILNWEIATFFRKQARITDRETPYGELSFADVPAADDLLALKDYEELDRALERLEERAPVRAACVRLRFLCGLTNREVGERLEISADCVKVHVCRGLKDLQSLMDLPTRGKGDS
ncbi:sigma-70 family RNA polymerase sigma factor [Streptomyces atriruber]|uniref:Sigma-70 family RNA polymerase sigma factor n=1 Tax=Streptomyces atriruber TaxID=545121 RepID=A0ABV3BEM5_9ACTN